MSKKDLTYFVRFGSLDLKKQKGFGKDKYGFTEFHSPPTTKGIYAMPLIAQELFLIGSLDKTQPEQFPKLPEWKENMTSKEKEIWLKYCNNEEILNEAEKKIKKVKSNLRKEFRKKKGNIWHHLIDCVDNCEVIARQGSWVKTSIKGWQKAFKKSCLIEKWDSVSLMNAKAFNEIKGINGYFSKDHYEVFFDEKV
jgi:hypothetical protein